MKKGFWMGLGMSLCLAGTGFAQQQGTEATVVELEDVVVTATKVEKGIGDVPVSASVITKEEMEQKARITFVDEALKYEAGVTQRRKKFADTMSSGALRGFSGNQRTLVLLDGMPLNDSYTGGTYLANLPIGNV
ncbi:MAG: TonB-dependent receptor plug domain-containing protein [bacterium]